MTHAWSYLVMGLGGIAASDSTHWLAQHMPNVLLTEAPLALKAWQWLALLVAFALAFVVGHLAARMTQSLLMRIASRTRARWDDVLVPRMAAPLRIAWALGFGWFSLAFLDLPPEFIGDARGIVRGGFVLVFFWASARSVDVAHQVILASDWGKAHPSSRSLLALAGRLLKVAVYAFGIVAILAELGFPVASLIAGLGIGGLALALAGQKTVENLFGAFSIGADQPFREGDFVRVEDFVGTVEAIGLRSTKFRTLDRSVISIPNGKLAEMRLESLAARDRLRFFTTLTVPFSARPAQVQALLQSIRSLLEAHPKLWRESYSVCVREFGEFGLTLEVMAWFSTTDWPEFVGIREQLLLGIVDSVEQARLELVYPTYTLRPAPNLNPPNILEPDVSTAPPQTR